LIILDVARRVLRRTRAEDIGRALVDVARLLGEDSLHVQRAKLERRLKAVVATRQRRREEVRRRRREVDVADVEPLEVVARLSLIGERHSVRRVELAPHVIVDVDVRSVANHADTLQRTFEIDLREEELRVAPRLRRNLGVDLRELRRVTAEISIALALRFYTKIEKNRQIETGNGDITSATSGIRVGGRTWHHHSACRIRET
jgi:hypothetical protein